MTIWRMRIACCIPKVKNTHSQYVILIVFPLQQWLHESGSMLRHTYIVCLVHLTTVHLLAHSEHCAEWGLTVIINSDLFTGLRSETSTKCIQLPNSGEGQGGPAYQPSIRLIMIVCFFVCFWRNSLQWARVSFTRFLNHIQRRTAVGRTPLNE